MSSSNPIPESPLDPQMSHPTPGDTGHSGAFWDIHDDSGLLTGAQHRAIELAVQGHSDSQIAIILNVNRKTIWRWKSLDNSFRQTLADARHQARALTNDRYQMLLSKAQVVLVQCLEDAESPNNRFRAAQAVLNMAGSFKPLIPETPIAKDAYWPQPSLPPKVG